MNTECFDCDFLVENNECCLKKLELYAKANVQISNENYPILHNFICPFKRTAQQLKKMKSDYDKWPLFAIEEDIIKENGFPYAVFMYQDDRLDFLDAAKQVVKLDHKPQYVHVTFKVGNQPEELLTQLVDIYEKHDIKYKLVINLDEELDTFYESFLAFRLNDMSAFTAIYYKNTNLKSNWTTYLSNRIHRELFSFGWAVSSHLEFAIYPRANIEGHLDIEGSNFLKKIHTSQCPYQLP